MKSTFFFSAAVLLVLAGCSDQPSVNLNDQIVHIDGKSYLIPAGMKASDHLATKRELAFFQRSGVVGCHDGDIIWESPKAHDMIAYAIRNGDNTIHSRLAKQGMIGCASQIH